MKLRERYKLNKTAKVGSESPPKSEVKMSQNRKFCKSKGGTICKDKYWNTITPEKRCNTTRISPASAEFMKNNSKHKQLKQGGITSAFLSFDEDDDNWTGRIWTKNVNDELLETFTGENKSSIIEQAKSWAFENNYNIEW